MKNPDAWLAKMAEAMGYDLFSNLPAERYDEAIGRLKTRLEKVGHAQAN